MSWSTLTSDPAKFKIFRPWESVQESEPEVNVDPTKNHYLLHKNWFTLDFDLSINTNKRATPRQLYGYFAFCVTLSNIF